MDTRDKAITSRENAQRSTGPKSLEGKSTSSQNAVRHGILSNLEVLPRLEKQEEWDSHRDAVLRDLAPMGAVETALAERVALTLWRLRRVAVYERESTTKFIDKQVRINGNEFGWDRDDPIKEIDERQRKWSEWVAELDLLLDPMRDESEAFRTDLACQLLDTVSEALKINIFNDEDHPERAVDMELTDYPDGAYPESLQWTHGRIKNALTEMAQFKGQELGDVLPVVREGFARVVKKMDGQRDAALEKADWAARDAGIMPVHTTEKIIKYEAHLERSLTRTLNQLERLQSVRHGGNPVVDVAS
jgi:hypothetical protein